MKQIRITCLMFACIAGLASLCAAAPGLPTAPGETEMVTGNTLVRATLIADKHKVEAGGTVTVAVQLDIEDGWHVYWHNPGDAGMAVDVTWKLPEGWEAGPLRWPLPRKYTEPGGITAYGYADRVLLLAELRAPADAPMGAASTLAAEVQWLVCKERCLAGEASVSAAVYHGTATESEQAGLIEQWRGQLPHAGRPDEVLAIDTSRVGHDKTTLGIAWAEHPPQMVQAFPHRVNGLDVQPGDAESTMDQTRIAFRIEMHHAAKAPSTVPVLIVYEKPDGKRAGFTVDILVRDEQ